MQNACFVQLCHASLVPYQICFAYKKRKIVIDAYFVGLKKAPGADFAPGACPPILSKKMMTFKCVFLFQKKELGVLFAPSSDFFLVTRGGIEPPLPP